MEIMLKKLIQKREGFTLIEILVVIGIIAVLATIVIIAINPARQFAQARDTQRTSNLNTILNAIGQNIADNRGIFTCSGSEFTLPGSATVIRASIAAADIYDCLVPTYMPAMVCDPVEGEDCDDSGQYNTAYTVSMATSGRITIAAPETELANPDLSVTR
ncbi:MAG: hypothetical protein A2855_00950 [Candidatus Liptonbacteria bacterium RIFCSPHIGHO2_01_FULL_57_28]|uniref:Type II secretion system protein GspG C-terminal domain-containing protein n=1 Tax=Candidatus Liptonbacteria bacterium RIFCSPHIGHO2_01_FULL_57_28 TaxID=1798647 RepID=A0A1G2CC86_9BACT|nr:MAG: hypothetical protein A2855_00950 [Candidatus Liptonbacteria bacterium RIFCSPHIGHO2_01_FULL_57_28]